MDIRIEQDPRDKKNKHFGCGKWHLVQIFVEVLGVWPTKSTIDGKKFEFVLGMTWKPWEAILQKFWNSVEFAFSVASSIQRPMTIFAPNVASSVQGPF